MSHVQHFALNTAGRDFVVGDVHGCFDQLRAMLDYIKFDTTCDRMFSVGDLVDRGTQSEEAIDWIAQPWFHAVRGNHEQMAIGVASGRHDLSNYFANGGAWFLAMDESRQKLFGKAFETLPYAIDVETPRGLVGIVHAEVAGNNWQAFCDALETTSSNNKFRNLREVALWARCRSDRKDTSVIEGVTCVVVGHTPQKHPIALGNVIYIDTGAVYGKPMTAFEMTNPTTFHFAELSK